MVFCKFLPLASLSLLVNAAIRFYLDNFYADDTFLLLIVFIYRTEDFFQRSHCVVRSQQLLYIQQSYYSSTSFRLHNLCDILSPLSLYWLIIQRWQKIMVVGGEMKMTCSKAQISDTVTAHHCRNWLLQSVDLSELSRKQLV